MISHVSYCGRLQKASARVQLVNNQLEELLCYSFYQLWVVFLWSWQKEKPIGLKISDLKCFSIHTQRSSAKNVVLTDTRTTTPSHTRHLVSSQTNEDLLKLQKV